MNTTTIRTTYVTNRAPYMLRRGTVANAHVEGPDGQPVCGRMLKHPYRLLPRNMLQYHVCDACEKRG